MFGGLWVRPNPTLAVNLLTTVALCLNSLKLIYKSQPCPMASSMAPIIFSWSWELIPW